MNLEKCFFSSFARPVRSGLRWWKGGSKAEKEEGKREAARGAA